MNSSTRKRLCSVGLSALTLLSVARADEWSQKTTLTFSGPVEIPGQVLPAGTYVFKLASSQSNRHIVQVFNKDQNHIYGTFLAIPDYRLHPSDKPIVRFEERAAGSPPAIKAWFYPSHNHGHEFVYPKKKAVALAQENHTPVPAMPAELEPTTKVPELTLHSQQVTALFIAPLKAEEPSGEEVELAEAFEVTPPALPDKLPSTATGAPLMGAIGLLSLATGLLLHFRAARQEQ
jgi:hypothetical protein